MKKIISALLLTVLVMTNVYADSKQSEAMRFFDKVREYIQSEYKFEASTDELYKNALNKLLKEHPELLEEALSGMTDELDRHSEYMTAQELELWMIGNENAFVGIGVTIVDKNGSITVVSAIDGSPAQKAGITTDDVIVEVDGTNVEGKGIEYARSLVLGEEGTEVTVGINRNGELKHFTVKRAAVKQTTVEHTVLDDEKTGYLSISQFASTTYDDVKKALDDFDSKGINKIIIDLRNNPGGEKFSVINVMSLFMPTGRVLNIEYKNPLWNENIEVRNDNYGKYKTVLLVNENSASAAEVFAGTYKDRKVGTVVGETTFGKGTVQNTQYLVTGGALKLTVATYTTGGGSQVNEIGVTPDVVVENTICPLYENTDIEQIEFAQLIDENSSKDNIYAIELRLSLAGIYPGDIDGVYDAETKTAIRIFQEQNQIPVNGDMDITTQVYLDNATRNITSVIDNQFNKALELMTKMD